MNDGTANESFLPRVGTARAEARRRNAANDETEQPLTYKQALMELSLLAKRTGQLAQSEHRTVAVVKLSTVILVVDRLLQELETEKKE